MKKSRNICIAVTLAAVFLLSVLAVYGEGSSEYQINWNGRPLAGVHAIVNEESTALPVRDLFPLIQFSISWDAATQTALLTRNDYQITLPLNTGRVLENGTPYTYSFPSQIIGGKLYVDSKVLTELVGIEIQRTDRTKIISLNNNALNSKIYIRDAALKSALNTVFGLPENSEPRVSDAKFRTTLTIAGKQIYALDGIEYFTHLTSLDISNNRITDIERLQDLPVLKTLNLSNNRIFDISPLRKMYTLVSLNLSGNKISYYEDLKNLNALKSLSLKDNPYTSESLKHLYYLRDQLTFTDFDLSLVTEPSWDTWNLRHDADFKIAVANDLYWIPANYFGAGVYKNEDLNSKILSNTPEGKASKVENIYDVLQYLQHIHYDPINTDALITDSLRHIAWKYPQIPQVTLNTHKGSLHALKNSLAYLLADDFLESGVLTVIDHSGMVKQYNYVKNSRTSVFEDPDDEDRKRTTTVYEYAIFDPESYLRENVALTATEDGTLESYNSSGKYAGNVHLTSDLMNFVKAAFPSDSYAFVYTTKIAAESRKNMPVGESDQNLGENARSIVFPNEPQNSGNSNIASRFSVLYDLQGDLFSFRYAQNFVTAPTWN